MEVGVVDVEVDAEELKLELYLPYLIVGEFHSPTGPDYGLWINNLLRNIMLKFLQQTPSVFSEIFF